MLPISSSSTSSACCIICSSVRILDTISDQPTVGQNKLKRFFELLERYLDDSSNTGSSNMFGGTRTIENYDVFPFEQLINAGLTSCQECSEVVNSFCKLFHQMKVIELQLNWKVHRLKNIMQGAQRWPARAKRFKESVKQLEVEIGISAEEIVEFKGTLIGKCRSKLGASLPMLKIKRFKPGQELETEEKVEPESDENADRNMVNGMKSTLEDLNVTAFDGPSRTGESKHTVDTTHANDDWSTSSDDDYFCQESPTLGLDTNIPLPKEDGHVHNDVSGAENDSDDDHVDQLGCHSNMDIIIPDCSEQNSNPDELDFDIKFHVPAHTGTRTPNGGVNKNVAIPTIESFVEVKDEPISEDLTPEVILSTPIVPLELNGEVADPLPLETPSSDLSGTTSERPRNRDTALRKCTPLLVYGTKLCKEKVVGHHDPFWNSQRSNFRCKICKSRRFTTRKSLWAHTNRLHKRRAQENKQ